MAYQVTGTAGNDVLNQAGDNGPGTIVGLAGDDCIFTGTGLATVTGDSGNDTVVLQAGNTGTVNGGTENDSVFGNPGSMVTFGGDGADVVSLGGSSAQTVVGGNDSNDGVDIVTTGNGNDMLFGNGGADFLNAGNGSDTYVGGAGNDNIGEVIGSSDLAFGNEGNDTINTYDGSDTAFGGLGNDYIVDGPGVGNPMWFGNEGADTVDGSLATGARTVVGGNDSADGSDSIFTGAGADFILGNGGNDTVDVNAGNDTAVGGFGNDSIRDGSAGNNLMFGNEGNDTLATVGASGTNTAFGGLGNDSIRMTDVANPANRDSLQGNEGNDTIIGNDAIDTISGGTGNDVFAYDNSNDDGDNATGGGPVELITDLDWSVDRFDVDNTTVLAANTGAGTGATLAASANNALAAVYALSGNAGQVAAQFTFAGRTYVAIDQTGNGTFVDTDDLLIDITGVTGTIATSNFI
jgi:Ca2+-binding RTX toxin-like protein